MSDQPGAPPPPPPDSSGSQADGPPPPPPSGGGSSDNRAPMIVLSYLWLLALVPLLVEKEDAEVQWHAKHGIVLMAAELILWITLSILSAISGGLGCLLLPFYGLISIAILVVHIVAIAKGLSGERFLIPGVSQYADRF